MLMIIVDTCSWWYSWGCSWRQIHRVVQVPVVTLLLYLCGWRRCPVSDLTWRDNDSFVFSSLVKTNAVWSKYGGRITLRSSTPPPPPHTHTFFFPPSLSIHDDLKSIWLSLYLEVHHVSHRGTSSSVHNNLKSIIMTVLGGILWESWGYVTDLISWIMLDPGFFLFIFLIYIFSTLFYCPLWEIRVALPR